jgi:hypothetical protein
MELPLTLVINEVAGHQHAVALPASVDWGEITARTGPDMAPQFVLAVIHAEASAGAVLRTVTTPPFLQNASLFHFFYQRVPKQLAVAVKSFPVTDPEIELLVFRCAAGRILCAMRSGGNQQSNSNQKLANHFLSFYE